MFLYVEASEACKGGTHGEKGGDRVVFRAALAAAANEVPMLSLGIGTAELPRARRRNLTCFSSSVAISCAYLQGDTG